MGSKNRGKGAPQGERICERLKAATRLIIVHDKNEVISIGTGTIINSRGDIITAAHVVTTRLPVRKEDVADPEITVLVRHDVKGLLQYRPAYCGITASLEYFREPISVDLALICPTAPMSGLPYIPINTNVPKIGNNVLMAGFSDEITMPFAFDENINYSHPSLSQLPSIFAAESTPPLLKSFFAISKSHLMIKSGMIGCVQGFEFSDVNNKQSYSGNLIYVDNVMHSGASGGPVLDQDGHLLAVISARALTKVATEDYPRLAVPSGAALATTIKPFMPFVRQLSK